MKTTKRYSWLRMLLIALCAIFGCVLSALGFTLPRGVFADGTGNYELTEIQLTKKEGYAFTASLTDPQKYDLVAVTVTYTEVLDEDSEETPATFSETLVLSGEGDTRTAATGEVVSFSFASDTITAVVTPREGYSAAADLENGSLSVAYEERKVSGIVAEYAGTGTPTISSRIEASNFRVNWEYNDGTKGELLQSVLYELNNLNLFPDSFPVEGPYG